MKITFMTRFFVLVLFCCVNVLKAQTFVGEVFTNVGFEYLKIEWKSDSVFVSTPYGQPGKTGYTANLSSPLNLTYQNGVNQWKLSGRVNANDLKLNISTPTGEERVVLKKQLEAPENAAKYIGNYTDEKGRTALVYERYGYLHLMSPFMEQTVSMKPIDTHTFWSTSGETSTFSGAESGKFQQLTITERNGIQYSLTRSFDIEVKDVWIPVNGDSLFGQLYLPMVEGQKPACLLLPGGGGRSQVENAAYEARLFAAHGMVALVFDKVGAGQSKGEVNFEHYTFQEKAKRYTHIFNYLAELKEVDASRVGIHGPSEGGRLSVMMAMDNSIRPAFVNATAAPLMDMKNGQLYAVNLHHRNLGISEENIVKVLRVWNHFYDGIIAEKLDSTEFETIRQLAQLSNRMFLPPLTVQMPLSPNKTDLMDEQVFKGASDLHCPVFFQYGENDERVNPTKSIQNFMMHTSDNQDVTIKIYPRGNHSFMTPEYQICQGYAFDKIKWLKRIGVL